MCWIEDPAIEFTLSFAISMGWLVIAVSFGAFSIFTYLLYHNSASQTSALFFLVPPVAAIIGWMLLNEGLTTLDMLAFILASAGVILATGKPIKSIIEG